MNAVLAVAWSGTASVGTLVAVLGLVPLFVLAAAQAAFSELTRTRAELIEGALTDRSAGQRVASLAAEPERWTGVVGLARATTVALHVGLVAWIGAHVAGSGGLWVAVALDAVCVFVFGWVTPTALADEYLETTVVRLAPLVSFLAGLVPLTWLADGLSRLGARLVGAEVGGTPDPDRVDEIRADLAALAEEQGFGPDDVALVESVAEARATIAREVMVPRTDMVAISAADRISEFVDVALFVGFSRFPVYGESLDDIVGAVTVKDAVRHDRGGGGEDAVAAIMRPAQFVPETKKAMDLLREMKEERGHMSIVVDEYGGTAGLVTLEDLLEELVGEIRDEDDHEKPPFVPLGDGVWRVAGSVNVDDVNDELGLHLPEDGEWDSIGGLVFAELGRVPENGDEVRVADTTLTVEVAKRRRVEYVIVQRTFEGDADTPDSGGPTPGETEAGS